MDLCGGDVYTHSTGECQLFDVQHVELSVYVSLNALAQAPLWIADRPQLTISTHRFLYNYRSSL